MLYTLVWLTIIQIELQNNTVYISIGPIYVRQRWRTYGTRAQSGTRDDFAWHAPCSWDNFFYKYFIFHTPFTRNRTIRHFEISAYIFLVILSKSYEALILI